MRPRTVAEVALAVGGVVSGPPGAGAALASRVVIDSRRAAPGDLFVALPGARADGHAFVADAAARGAVAALVGRERGRPEVADAPERPGGSGGSPVLVEVDDPGLALAALAADERGRTAATVVAITGSSGKTCTKDLTAAVLSTRLRVTASPASYNNEIGLPLTLLALDEGTEAVVTEMGMRGPGQIRSLCDIARPQVGVVTNVGVAHIELLGSREAIREAKAELPASLPADGVAVLNADDASARSYAGRTPARSVLFGLGPGADVLAEDVELEPATGRASFVLVAPDGRARARLAVPGEHMVANALAAAAVGWALGVPVADAAAALSTARVSGGRMDVFETADGVRVIDDAYNANPDSMAAGLKALRRMAAGGRTVAVLGEMAEIGPIAPEEHARVGELLARLGIDALIAVGPGAAPIAAAAAREGLEPDLIVACEGPEAAVEAVRSLAGPGDLVLVKASRVARLDRVARVLRGAEAAEPGPADLLPRGGGS